MLPLFSFMRTREALGLDRYAIRPLFAQKRLSQALAA